MKKSLIIFSLLLIVGCNNSKTKEEVAVEVANKEDMIRQRTIDSMTIVNLEANKPDVIAPSESSNTVTTSEETTSKKGLNSKAKGALIGTGAGIVVGAVTGAAVSNNKGKGAAIGGAIGGAAGSGIGFGVGAKKENKKADK